MDDDRAALSSIARALRERIEWEAALGSIGATTATASRATADAVAAASSRPVRSSTPRAIEPGAPMPDRRAEPPSPTTPAASRMALPERVSALGALQKQVEGCKRCRLNEGRTRTVFGVGNPAPRLCFIGEGPGRDEDLRGEPFVGRAGQLLTRMIRAMGIERDDVYICNVVKCRPPENRTPLPDEMATCAGFLEGQLEVVAPEVIVALGSCAARQLLQTTSPMGRLRGSFHAHRGIPVMPTYHPAYLLRNEEAKKPVWDDLKQVMARLGLPDPRAAR